MSKSPTTGSMKDTIEHISQSGVGSHNILIYPGIEAFRKLYSIYVKRQLRDRNEIVFVLPYYETEDKVREVLSESFVDTPEEKSEMVNDRISKYEKEGSLVIKDSVKIYTSGSHDGIDKTILSLLREIVKRAENLGKSGVTIIADLGSFYHHLGDAERLVDYELSLPSQFDDMKMNGLCVYHKEDFEKRLTQEQKQKLLQHHEQVFIVEDR
jgi:hypothetical protein